MAQAQEHRVCFLFCAFLRLLCNTGPSNVCAQNHGTRTRLLAFRLQQTSLADLQCAWAQGKLDESWRDACTVRVIAGQHAGREGRTLNAWGSDREHDRRQKHGLSCGPGVGSDCGGDRGGATTSGASSGSCSMMGDSSASSGTFFWVQCTDGKSPGLIKVHDSRFVRACSTDA